MCVITNIHTTPDYKRNMHSTVSESEVVRKWHSRYTLHPALRKRHVKKIRRAERGSEAKKTTRPGEDASGRRGGLLEKVEGEPGPSGVAETNQPEEEQGEDAWEEWEVRLEEEMHDQMVDPFEVDQREVDQHGQGA